MFRRIISILFIIVLFVSWIPSVESTQKVEADTMHSDTTYQSWTDNGGYKHTTAVIYDGNTLVYCINEDAPAPNSSGTGYDNGVAYNDESQMAILYYGYGGGGYKGSGGLTDYVKTWVALNNWRSGKTSSRYPANSDSFIKSLYTHATSKDAPIYRTAFSKSSVSSSIKDNQQVSDSITVSNPGNASFSIPSQVTVHVSSGSSQTGGAVTVKDGQSFYFTAPLSYNSDFSTGDVNAWETHYASILYLPITPGYQALLQTPFVERDPKLIAGFTVHFWARTAKVNITYEDQYTPSNVFKTVSGTVTIGSTYSYDVPSTFTSSGNTYDRVGNDTSYGGTMGNTDVSKIFYYKLQRSVTVNYLDSRTNKSIQPPKVTTVHQGDSYKEVHPDIQGYNYLKETGNAESGAIGTSNIVINYYYSKPLATVKLNKFQVYTAKASEGLPVRVYMTKVLNYSGISDLTDTSKEITLSLYQGSTIIDSKSYTASAVPTEVDFKIPTNGLTVNTNKPYTVKLEKFNPLDFEVPVNAQSLTTRGYTSFEGGVSFNPVSNPSVTKKYIVMTEITPTTPVKTYYETFNLSATHLANKKTGYGVTTNVSVGYMNDLGNDYQYGSSVAQNSLTFEAPSKLQDSYLNYPVTSSTVEVPMVKSDVSGISGSEYSINDKFIFPHVNVEKQTGKLFTDQEVASHDSRIHNSIVDGGNKFYSPIWADLGTYNVDYKSNAMGVNKVSLVINDNWKLYAQMIETMDSTTKSLDEILFLPVNPNNPFSYGLPLNWTVQDANWLKY